MTISAAAIVFKDPLTPINISGLFVTILSIAAYNYMKIKKMREEARGETTTISSATSGAGVGYVQVDHNEEEDDDDAVSTSFNPDLEGEVAGTSPVTARGDAGEGDRLI